MTIGKLFLPDSSGQLLYYEMIVWLNFEVVDEFVLLAIAAGCPQLKTNILGIVAA